MASSPVMLWNRLPNGSAKAEVELGEIVAAARGVFGKVLILEADAGAFEVALTVEVVSESMDRRLVEPANRAVIGTEDVPATLEWEGDVGVLKSAPYSQLGGNRWGSSRSGGTIWAWGNRERVESKMKKDNKARQKQLRAIFALRDG